MHNEVRVDPDNEIAEANELNDLFSDDTVVTTGNADKGAFNQLRITKTQTGPVPPTAVATNGTLVYNLHVDNLGNDPVTEIVVKDFLPTGSRFISHDGSAAGGVVTCTGGALSGSVNTLADDSSGTTMRTAAVLATLVSALAVAAAAGAQPNTASTELLGTPTAGQTLSVRFTVFGTTPVVPYEYALRNTCTYPSKPSGHFTLGQEDDIVVWTDRDASGNPQVTMPVYLQSVPAGSACKVSLVRNNTVVTGPTESYTVG
jgi:uncharacterized repeat protein (TIGR01451 family)